MTLRSLAPLLCVACGPRISYKPEETGAHETGAHETGETGQPAETADSAETAETADSTVDTGTGWPALLVNELMASNQSTVQDPTGAWPDWIELYNPTAEAVDLEGWTVTDDLDEPDAHALTGLSIAPGEHLLLWADGDPELGADHLSFALESSGESFGLFAPDRTPADGLSFGQQATDVALARSPDGGETWTLTTEPTPGASNGG